MNYTLMHGNIPVCDLEVHGKYGSVEGVGNIHNPNRLPIGVEVGNGTDRALLNNWWERRSIPASRDNIGAALEALGINTSPALAVKSLGLSLSDHYWIKPINTKLEWSDVNFYDNAFSGDVGDVLVNNKSGNISNTDFNTPDSVADGVVKKRWTIINGVRVLLKGGKSPFYQEPFNEIIASKIISLLGFNAVNYYLYNYSGELYSACECFTDINTELVPAAGIYKSQERLPGVSKYEHFISQCNRYNIGNFNNELDKMMIVDYIIGNSDRHFNNFGFMRDTNTLEWRGFAPIYDNGMSLWCDVLTPGSMIQFKPFDKAHLEQLQAVNNLNVCDISRLGNVRDIILDTYSLSNNITKNRAAAIADAVVNNVALLNKMIKLGDKAGYIDVGSDPYLNKKYSNSKNEEANY